MMTKVGRKGDLKSFQKSGELREIFNSGRKTGEDSEYRESPGKIGRVGKYGNGVSRCNHKLLI